MAATPDRSPFTSAQNTGTPGIGEALREALQRHGLAGTGGAGDEAVPVGELQEDVFGLDALADEHAIIGNLDRLHGGVLGCGRLVRLFAFSVRAIRRRFWSALPSPELLHWRVVIRASVPWRHSNWRARRTPRWPFGFTGANRPLQAILTAASPEFWRRLWVSCRAGFVLGENPEPI